jgi:hypothetical protein
MTWKFLANLIGSGSLDNTVKGIALALLVVAICIWVMEFSGHTISRRGFVPNNVVWNARSIALVAVSAAIFIAGRPLQLQFIPGIGGFNPSFVLAPVLVSLFGLPGAVGVTFSMPIGDAVSGALTVGSVAGCLGMTFITWFTYKLCYDASLRSVRGWIGLYAGGVIIGPLIDAITIPGWLDFVHLVPPAVAWGGVAPAIILNSGIITAVVAPILLFALFPPVRQWGLYWKDAMVARQGQQAGSSRARTAAARSGGPLPDPLPPAGSDMQLPDAQ